MQVQKISKQKQPLFKSCIGKELQEKILLAKSRKLFTKEQSVILKKIEDDGLDAVLELSNKIVIIKQNGKKGVVDMMPVLSLKKENKSHDIADMSFSFTKIPLKKQSIFHIHKFLRIFNEDFNLPEKIKKAWEQL